MEGTVYYYYCCYKRILLYSVQSKIVLIVRTHHCSAVRTCHNSTTVFYSTLHNQTDVLIRREQETGEAYHTAVRRKREHTFFLDRC